MRYKSIITVKRENFDLLKKFSGVRDELEYIKENIKNKDMKSYKNFRSVKEVRRSKKCPVLNFQPIRESEIYKDMQAMGWTEMIAENPIGIEKTGPEEQRYFKDRLGNIAFKHESMKSPKMGYPQYNIMHNGSIRVVVGPSKSSEFPRLNTDLRRACMTVEDYLFKMTFLVKYILKMEGFPITESEVYGPESYKEVIRRKIEEDPSNVSKISVLPPSMKKSDDLMKGASVLKRFGKL